METRHSQEWSLRTANGTHMRLEPVTRDGRAYLCSGSVSPAGVLQIVLAPVDAIATMTTA
jgi:hypothetical protein